MPVTDKECVRLCLDGHPEAFRHLVERHEPALLAYLGGLLRDEDLALEVAQETFVRSFFALSGLRKPESFLSWLIGIATRVAREGTRKRRKDAALILQEPAQGGAGPSRDYDLDSAVAALPERYRDVVLLRFYEGLSCAEVGERIHVPVGTVTKRLSRAYEMLRKVLGNAPVRGDLEVHK